MKNSLPCNSVLTLSRNYRIDFTPPNIIPLTSDMIREELRKKDYSDHSTCSVFKFPYYYNLRHPFIRRIYDIKQELVDKGKVSLDMHSHVFFYHIGNEDQKNRAREMISSVLKGRITWVDLYVISDDSREGSRVMRGKGSMVMIEEETEV